MTQGGRRSAADVDGAAGSALVGLCALERRFGERRQPHVSLEEPQYVRPDHDQEAFRQLEQLPEPVGLGFDLGRAAQIVREHGEEPAGESGLVAIQDPGPGAPVREIRERVLDLLLHQGDVEADDVDPGEEPSARPALLVHRLCDDVVVEREHRDPEQ